MSGNITLFVLIGATAGILAGLFGIGGGILIVPALIILAGFPILSATGTSLAALMLPVGILGVYEYYKYGHVNVTAALGIAGGLVLGIWVGSMFAQRIDPLYLKRAFAIFIVIMAVKIWTGK